MLQIFKNKDCMIKYYYGVFDFIVHLVIVLFPMKPNSSKSTIEFMRHHCLQRTMCCVNLTFSPFEIKNYSKVTTVIVLLNNIE